MAKVYFMTSLIRPPHYSDHFKYTSLVTLDEVHPFLQECAENKNRLEVTMKQLKEEINQIEKDLQRIEMDTQV